MNLNKLLGLGTAGLASLAYGDADVKAVQKQQEFIEQAKKSMESIDYKVAKFETETSRRYHINNVKTATIDGIKDAYILIDDDKDGDLDYIAKTKDGKRPVSYSVIPEDGLKALGHVEYILDSGMKLVNQDFEPISQETRDTLETYLQ